VSTDDVRYPILELRQYTLRPGQRDVLINLFDREFVEAQEAIGMPILGQFRDLDRPDRFVWLRGFHDMPGRARSLATFYGGPLWKAHSAEANATMLDVDNVLLLRPASEHSGFPAPAAPRPPLGHTAAPPSRVLATLFYRDHPFDKAFMDVFDHEVRPVLVEAEPRRWRACRRSTPRTTSPDYLSALARTSSFGSRGSRARPTSATTRGGWSARTAGETGCFPPCRRC
jgi:NIPSNAP